VKRGSLSTMEIQALRGFSDSRRFDLDYYPGIRPGEANRYNRFPEPVYYKIIGNLLEPTQRLELYRTYPFDVRPVTDDRPFFSYVLRLSRLGQAFPLVREKWLFFIEGGLLIPVMLVQATVAAVLLILFPTWFRVRAAGFEAEWAAGRVFIYFSCIALGFMGIEMAMIQRLILYLVHPVYAISTVLATLLLFAGIGSMLTTQWSSTRISDHVRILGALSLLILIETLFLPWVMKNLLGIPLIARFALVMLFLAPLGLLMGMPFPLGMERLKRSGQEAALAWAWAINGSTSVVAAILSVVLALYVGMTGVFIMAAIAYGIAAWTASWPWLADTNVSGPHRP
ncbi:MAG TPA: SAM-dependent methyltransferase, partial [Nitrospiria bacterium]|nr:SAM-dependent methyltransferase [Nitrospiria bacterium]